MGNCRAGTVSARARHRRACRRSVGRRGAAASAPQNFDPARSRTSGNSEGEKQAAINKAQGEASAIRLVAEATAAGLYMVAQAIDKEGGMSAANLKLAEQYIGAFANLAKQSNTLIVPSNVSDLAGLVASARSVLDKKKKAA